GIADGLANICTLVPVLIVKDSCFHDCDSRVLAKLDNRRIVIVYSGSRKIAYSTLVRSDSSGSGLVGHLSRIDIRLGNGVCSGIDPSFGNVKYSVAIGVTTCRTSQWAAQWWDGHTDVRQSRNNFVCCRLLIA